MEYLKVANGLPMAILCGITILIVLVQPAIMSIMAWKRGKELGLTTDDMKKTVKSSAVFSIIPSLPIIVSYLVLVPALGRFFPWLRLSVVGSAAYETMVANMAANAFGYETIFNTNLPIAVFLNILFIVSIGIIGGNIFNLIFLKAYDKKVKQIKSSNAALVPILTGAMFVALYGVFSAPTLTNTSNPVGIASFLAAGAAAVGINKAAQKHPKLKEFALSLSLIAGMIAACIFNLFL